FPSYPALLLPRGRRDDLERRAGLVALADGDVPSLRRGGDREAIGIEARPSGDGEDIAAARVGNDDRSLGRASPRHGGVQLLLRRVLDGLVERQLDAGAGAGGPLHLWADRTSLRV